MHAHSHIVSFIIISNRKDGCFLRLAAGNAVQSQGQSKDVRYKKGERKGHIAHFAAAAAVARLGWLFDIFREGEGEETRLYQEERAL